MELGALLQSSGLLCQVGGKADLRVDVRQIATDSRQVGPGCLFVAISGTRHRGVDFVSGAVQAGAAAVVVDEALPPDAEGLGRDVTLLHVSHAREAAGLLAGAFFGHPSRHLKVIGVTGTNGKTTTTILAAQLLTAAGFKAAALGTTGLWTPDGTRASALTTPEPVDLQRTFADLRDEGFSHVAIEVSSHALDQHRVAGTQFAAAVWTNVSRDHLDYHGSMDRYALAKARLFLDLGVPVDCSFVNADDDYASQPWHAGRAQAWSLGEHTAAEHQVVDVRESAEGLAFTLRTEGSTDLQVRCPLLGRHNVENLTGALLACRALGVDPAVLADACRTLQAPRGRLEPVANPLGALVVVDYAHTPDGLDKVLHALRPLVRQGGRLVVAFGCGGDRDRGKRPLMGKLAAELADLTFVTSDNPRSEQPETIAAEIARGMDEAGAVRLEKVVPSALQTLGTRHGYVVEVDREQAIRRAIFTLRPGDVLCIAGKGHETTQTIGKDVRPFDDAVVAARWLAQHRGSAATGPSRPDGFAFDGTVAKAACGGDLLVPGARWTSWLCTDSRQLAQGALFVALKGDRFDGADFLHDAVAKGAAGLICAQGRGQPLVEVAAAAGAFLLEVADPLVALGDLARDHRRRFQPLLVGVTGSNGKTTTKELTALALSPLGQAGGEVLATHGNHNNRIGVPLTLARLGPQHRAAVVEMGMSEPGEIRELARIAEPKLGIITSIAEAHLLGLGSIQAIADEKADLVRALPADGVAVLPTPEPLLDPIAATLTCRVVRYGRGAGDVRLVGEVQVDGLSQRFTADVGGTVVQVVLPGLGVHLAHNALGALALAWVAGVDPHAAAAALQRYQPVGQRMLPSRIGPWLVLEDCYNANPRSTETALDTLRTLPGPRAAVLGSMLELGSEERRLHARVGSHAARTGVDLLVVMGEFAPDYARGAVEGGLPQSAVIIAADPVQAAEAVRRTLPTSGTVLVKGSRGARMERVVAELRAAEPVSPTTPSAANTAVRS